MNILLHRRRRSREIWLVQFRCNILDSSTAQIVREADESVELILVELLSMSAQLKGSTSNMTAYSSLDIFINTINERLSVALQQLLPLLLGDRRRDIIAITRGLTRMPIAYRPYTLHAWKPT